MSNPKPTHAILWRKTCGCVVGVEAYRYEWRKDTAIYAAEQIKGGLLPEVLTWAEYRQRASEHDVLDDCPHGTIGKNGTQQATLLQAA